MSPLNLLASASFFIGLGVMLLAVTIADRLLFCRKVDRERGIGIAVLVFGFAAFLYCFAFALAVLEAAKELLRIVLTTGG